MYNDCIGICIRVTPQEVNRPIPWAKRERRMNMLEENVHEEVEVEESEQADEGDDLFAALEQIRNSEDEEVEEAEEEIEETEGPEEVEEETPEDTLEQTPEENAQFAEQRRQRQFEERFQSELQNRAEYQLAKKLEAMYGMPIEDIQKQIEEAELQNQSKETGVPIEYLRQQQEMERRIQEMEHAQTRYQYESWKMRVDKEGADLQSRYNALTLDDITNAQTAMLQQFGNVDMPLEQVVWAMYGEKIANAIQQENRQKDLAERSGRKKPVNPVGGKSPEEPTLTAEEERIARELGVSPADYLKYK